MRYLLQADPVYIQTGIYSQIFHPLSTTCILPFICLVILNYRYTLYHGRIQGGGARVAAAPPPTPQDTEGHLPPSFWG